MIYEKQTARIERLIRLINYSDTGTAEELAYKLGVSRIIIFNDLEFLKAKGYQIVFCREANSYQIEKKRNNFALFNEMQWGCSSGY